MSFSALAGNMAKDLGSSALGIVPKAMLILHTEDDGAAAANPMAQTKKALEGAAGAGAAGGALSGAHVLEVQYNPSSISIQANSVVTPFQYLQQNIDNGIPAQSFRDPAVVLSVELYFDDMNPKDAFMIDKLRLSVGDAVSGVSGLVKAAKGETYSVMPQTNGLLAALIRDKTRMVTFKWADMSFTGEMTEANASYTMFSVSGRPVRSVVKLSITQEVKAGDEKYWTKAFDSAFGDETAAKTTVGKSFADRYGNLLNIGF